MELGAVLILLALLQIKHLFADFYLQNMWMLSAREVYAHPGRAAHCAIHIAGTAICFWLTGVGFGLALTLIVVEFILHFHIDFGKGRWGAMKDYSPMDASYWRAFGVDQALHHLTYIWMVWMIA